VFDFSFDEISLTFWIFSQIFALIALVIIIWAFQVKSKSRTLALIVIFNSLMAASTALLGNWLMVGIYCVAALRDVVFLWREKKYPDNRNISLATLLSFIIIAVAIAAFTIDWFADAPLLILAVVIQIMALFIIYGSWAKGIHMVRISRISFSIFVGINHVLFLNFTGVVIEAVSITTVTIFYVRFFAKKRAYYEGEQITNEENINPDN